MSVCLSLCALQQVKQVREEPDVGVATAELTLVVEGLESKTAALSKELEEERLKHQQQIEGMTAEISELKKNITTQIQDPKTGEQAACHEFAAFLARALDVTGEFICCAVF